MSHDSSNSPRSKRLQLISDHCCTRSSECRKPYSRSAETVSTGREAEPVRADVKGTQHLSGPGRAGLTGGPAAGRAAARAGAMAKLLSCVLGPRLYKIYRERDSERAPSSVPGTPTSVTNPHSSSWVSRFSPGYKNSTAQTPLRPLLPRSTHYWKSGETACQASFPQSLCSLCFLG